MKIAGLASVFYRKTWQDQTLNMNHDDLMNMLDDVHNRGMQKFIRDSKEAERKKNRKSYPERHPFIFWIGIAILTAILGAIVSKYML